MKAKDLTTQQRIEILEDVLKKLESGDTHGGLCYKIINSAFKLFKISYAASEIIPLLTIENAKRVTEVASWVSKGDYWWNCYDFENRIKMVKWMIEMEKSLLNK